MICRVVVVSRRNCANLSLVCRGTLTESGGRAGGSTLGWDNDGKKRTYRTLRCIDEKRKYASWKQELDQSELEDLELEVEPT